MVSRKGIHPTMMSMRSQYLDYSRVAICRTWLASDESRSPFAERTCPPRATGATVRGLFPQSRGLVRFRSDVAFFLLCKATPCRWGLDEFRPRMRHIGPRVPPLFRASYRPA